MKSDLQISQEKKLKNISEVAKKIGLKDQHLSLLGSKIAKIDNVPVSYTHLTLPTILRV